METLLKKNAASGCAVDNQAAANSAGRIAESPAQVLRVDRIPSITWHRLKMNDAEIDVSGVVVAPADAVELSCGEAVVAHKGESALFAEALATAKADAFFETGMGGEAAAWLSANAAKRAVLEIPAGVDAGEVVVHIDGVDAACAIAAIDVIARPSSAVRLVFEADSPHAGAGIVGHALRLLADQNAHVEIDFVQTLDSSWKYLEDTGIVAADDAEIGIVQTVLGAGESYVGLAAALNGYRSSCAVDTRYIGQGAETVDFNYILRHRGAKSHGVLDASGVLCDASRKILRGTIDLIHGCKGSVGRESENVLIISEKARNKTIPVILCDEDDVRGDHGATIGHVNPEQLEYLQSRGLSVAEAEGLFVRAVFDYAREHAPSERSRAAIDRLQAAKEGGR